MTSNEAGELGGMRVLVVGDEGLVALLLEEILDDLGCQVLASAARVAAARELVARKNVDCAILDVNVGGETVYPVAEMLAQLGVPFMFVTGYSKTGVDPAFRDHPILQKPFLSEDLRKALMRLK